MPSQRTSTASPARASAAGAPLTSRARTVAVWLPGMTSARVPTCARIGKRSVDALGAKTLSATEQQECYLACVKRRCSYVSQYYTLYVYMAACKLSDHPKSTMGSEPGCKQMQPRLANPVSLNTSPARSLTLLM